MGIGFRSFEAPATSLAIPLDSITSPDAAVKISDSVNSAAIGLPLNYLKDTTSYIFYFDDALFDTLTLAYTTKLEYVSGECGERFAIEGLQIVNHTFDSISLVNATPAFNAQTNHIQIYR